MNRWSDWTAILCVALMVFATMPGQASPQDLNLWTAIGPADLDSGDDFGWAVARSGEWLVAGAPSSDPNGSSSGSATFFRATNGWTETQTVAAGDGSDNMGHSVAISGSWAAIGAPYAGSGKVYLYQLSGSTWVLRQTLEADQYRFGWSLAMEGSTLLVGAPNDDSLSVLASPGAVHVYIRSGSSWTETQELKQSSLGTEVQFGFALAMDGSRVLVGSPSRLLEEELFPGQATFYQLSSGRLSNAQTLSNPNGAYNCGAFGGAVALDGSDAVIGGDPQFIGIYVECDGETSFYERLGSAWSRTESFYFQTQAASIHDGVAVLGSRYSYTDLIVLEKTDEWTPVQQMTASSSSGITSLVLDGQLFVGLPDDDVMENNAGAVRVFVDDELPVAVTGYSILVTDLDRDGVEVVHVDGSASYDPDGSIVSHRWLLDDEVVATTAEADLELPVGRHGLRLMVEDDDGLSDWDLLVVTVEEGPEPEADFLYTPRPAKVGKATQFQDQSTAPLGVIMTWDWDFDGDGHTDATAQDPRHDFTTSGRHEVTLDITTSQGDELQVSKRVTVSNQPPVADAGPDIVLEDEDGDGKETVTLDGSGSTDPDGSVRSYRWTEDGKSKGSSASVSVTVDVGVHTFRLRVQDDDQSAANDEVVVLLKPNKWDTQNNTADKYRPEKPTAAIGWELLPQTHPHRTVRFTDRSQDPETEVIMRAWDFNGDGVTDSTDKMDEWTFPDYGFYTVHLLVTDTDGREAGVEETITIENAPPRVAFSPDRLADVPVGLPIVFHDETEDPEDALVSWSWDFGDGTTSTRTDLGHVFMAPGDYNVTLTVVDDGGAEATATGVVQVGSPSNETGNWTLDEALAALENATAAAEDIPEDRFQETGADDPGSDGDADPDAASLKDGISVKDGRLEIPGVPAFPLWWLLAALGAIILVALVARRLRR